MHGRGACMVGGHVWWGDMHDRGCAWQGVCMARGVCMAGGKCGRGHAWQGGMCGRYYEIRSMSRLYASHWNAFLLIL